MIMVVHRQDSPFQLRSKCYTGDMNSSQENWHQELIELQMKSVLPLTPIPKERTKEIFIEHIKKNKDKQQKGCSLKYWAWFWMIYCYRSEE